MDNNETRCYVDAINVEHPVSVWQLTVFQGRENNFCFTLMLLNTFEHFLACFDPDE